MQQQYQQQLQEKQQQLPKPTTEIGSISENIGNIFDYNNDFNSNKQHDNHNNDIMQQQDIKRYKHLQGEMELEILLSFYYKSN